MKFYSIIFRTKKINKEFFFFHFKHNVFRQKTETDFV